MIIIKCGKKLLQSVTGTTKCDKRLLRSAAGVQKCDIYYQMRYDRSPWISVLLKIRVTLDFKLSF